MKLPIKSVFLRIYKSFPSPMPPTPIYDFNFSVILEAYQRLNVKKNFAAFKRLFIHNVSKA